MKNYDIYNLYYKFRIGSKVKFGKNLSETGIIRTVEYDGKSIQYLIDNSSGLYTVNEDNIVLICPPELVDLE